MDFIVPKQTKTSFWDRCRHEKVQEIWEGTTKRLDALLAELKEAQQKGANK